MLNNKFFKYAFAAVLILITTPIIMGGETTPNLDMGKTSTLDSTEGIKLFKECELNNDFFKLIRFFNSQENLAYCGVASSVIVLNSLDVPKPSSKSFGTYPFFTQSNFFTDENSAIKSPSKVAESGMSLDQLEKFLKSHEGVMVEKYYASKLELDTFRQKACNALSSNQTRLIVNYPRSGVGQKGGGHISPVAAYHEKADSFLILDVSQYRYSPLWVPANLLFEAMNQPAGDTSSTRGFVIVSTMPAREKFEDKLHEN